MIDYLRARFKEPSTWRGAVLLAASLAGIAIEEDQVDALVQLTFAIVGVLGVFTRDPDKIA